ncbi:hypothetical protein SELMODRAFT_432467 [Selaginella moellendorffii]|uniref:Uncharacterized protein n=1 Tax=Selaginella moellendorffii TaxID=88036 RepID=D8TG36_SELML|nr:hypothetical protein SELMODRAFT_432467 [Selaginella moellendorffii]
MAFRRVISLPSMPPRVRTLTPTRKSSNPETMMKESLGTGPEVSNQRNGKGDGTTSAGAWAIRSRSSPPSPLATTSSVYLELEESLAKHLAGDLSEETGINFADSRVFSLSPAPSRVFVSSSGSLLLAHTASLISASLGQPRWIGLRLGLSSTQAGIEAAEDDTEVCSFEWPHATGFVGLPKRGVLGLMRFTPAEDRKAPAAVEIALRVSIATQAITLDDPLPR